MPDAAGTVASGSGKSGSCGHAWTFNASKSSTVYGSSSTVTPLSCKCKFYIRY